MTAPHEQHVARLEEILFVEVGRAGLSLHRVEGHVKVAVTHHGKHVRKAVEDPEVNARRLLSQLHDHRHEERVERVVDRHDPNDALRMQRIKGRLIGKERISRAHGLRELRAQRLQRTVGYMRPAECTKS